MDVPLPEIIQFNDGNQKSDEFLLYLLGIRWLWEYWS